MTWNKMHPAKQNDITNKELKTLYDTICSKVPNELTYQLGYIHGFYPVEYPHNIANIHSWIQETKKRKSGTAVWYKQCKNNSKYDNKYVNRFKIKIQYYNFILQTLKSAL